ncbi:hypothetical protein HY030_02740 [Candidatus Gottesmanbacteria bacterium]|nr:hypothetical protein [Candidatus Gottesmanbacteria bacterium]
MAKQYILGLIEAKRKEVDLSQFTLYELRSKLLEIGKTEDEPDKLF